MQRKVRKAEATADDAVKLFDLLVEMHGVTGMTLPAMDQGLSFERIRQGVEEGVVLVVDGEDTIDGALCIIRSNPWWSFEQQLIDGFFYVRPGARTGGTAKMLLNSGKEWAKEQGKDLVISLLTKDNLFMKECFLAKNGFERIGSVNVFKLFRE